MKDSITMTKKRFLSRRLACLLTSALVATPFFLNSTTAKSADLTIANAGTTTLTAAGANNYSFTGATGTLAVNNAEAITLTGTITTLTNNVGVLAINDTTTAAGAATAVTITGIVGSSGLSLNVINLGVTDTTGGHAIFSSNVFATTINVVGGDALEASKADFRGNVTGNIVLTQGLNGGAAGGGLPILIYDGTTAQTSTGNITTGTAGAGTLEGSNTTSLTVTGTVGATGARLLELTAADGSNTFQGAIFARTLDINTIIAAEFVSVTAGNAIGINNAGAIEIANGAVIRLDPGAVAGTTVFDVTAAATDGVVIAAGAITIRPSAQFNTGSVVLFNGDQDDTVVASELEDIAVTGNALTSYSAVAGAVATQDVNIVATAKSDATTASELGVNTNKAAALRAASTATGTAFATDRAAAIALDNAVNAYEGLSATADTDLANQVAPQTDMITGSTIAAKAVTSGVQNVMASRLASLRSGDAYSTGVVTGNGMAANSGFIQAFGSTVEQKAKGNEFGYDADTTGFAIGVDGKVDGGAVIGISYARSEADVDGKGTGRAKNDITTDSVSLYADYATSGGYIEGSITYGQSENKGSRIVNTAGLDRTYSSDYDSEQYSFRLSGGVPQSVGTDAFITPFATATISQIKADAYTERSTTANDALRLRVNQDTVDSQVGSIGVKYHQVFKEGNKTFTPEIKVAVNQEFGDAKITTTNTYQGGGASFKNSTDVEKTSGTAGIGLSVASDNITFNISYDVDVKDQYLGHGAQAKLSAKF